MICIRADANKKIGTGHIMRCLSIAAELKKLGKEVLFVSADEAAAGILESRGQDFCVLSSAYDDMEAELPALLLLLAERKPELLLIDSYFVTPRYLEQVRACVKTAYMDDLCAFSYPVDMVINYNIYADLLPYERQPLYLLGCTYAPLREEFRSVSYAVREKAENILITTGGGDMYNLAGQIVRAALADARTAKLQYHVVSGAMNNNLADLREMERENPNVHVHCNVTNMAELMQECDIAVTAGGSTVYELCAVGVPFVCFSFVNNQERIVETFVEKKLVAYGGNYCKDGASVIGHIVEHMAALASNQETRESYSRKERALVDGLGAERIAGIMAGVKK